MRKSELELRVLEDEIETARNYITYFTRRGDSKGINYWEWRLAVKVDELDRLEQEPKPVGVWQPKL